MQCVLFKSSASIKNAQFDSQELEDRDRWYLSLDCIALN